MAQVFRGMGVSAGVAVGQVLLFETEALPVVPVPIPPERVEEEIERFRAAREKARGELQEVRERTKEALGETYARMLDAQLLILDDPALIQDTCQRIRLGRVYAGWALKEVVGEDGSCGVLVDPDDIDGIAGTLRGLLRDREKRRALGSAGFRRSFLFSEEKMVENYLMNSSNLRGSSF